MEHIHIFVSLFLFNILVVLYFQPEMTTDSVYKGHEHNQWQRALVDSNHRWKWVWLCAKLHRDCTACIGGPCTPGEPLTRIPKIHYRITNIRCRLVGLISMHRGRPCWVCGAGPLFHSQEKKKNTTPLNLRFNFPTVAPLQSLWVDLPRETEDCESVPDASPFNSHFPKPTSFL